MDSIRNKIVQYLDKLIDYLDRKRAADIAQSNPLSDRHYIGSRFIDSLFNSPGTKRERMAIWKLVHFPQAEGLCNGSWKWFAVNIPLNLVDKRQPNGDIDILVRMLTPVPHGEWPSIYRVFEVKSSKIDIANKAKSLKSSEKSLKKLKAQLSKLKAFGPEQLFLLDVYVLQAGYSSKNDLFPKNLNMAIASKIKEINDDEIGYVIFLLEQIRGFDEDASGIVHFPQNMKRSKPLVMKSPFKQLVDHINHFDLSTPGGPIIGYCRRCKKLLKFDMFSKPICPTCRSSLFDE